MPFQALQEQNFGLYTEEGVNVPIAKQSLQCNMYSRSKTLKLKNKQKNTKIVHNSVTQTDKDLTIFSANADGLRGKTHNLKYHISECNAHIFTIQETKHRTKGKFHIDQFEIFESIRRNKEKGGTLLGIHKSLEPVLVHI